FFLDRQLGRYKMAGALRKAGLKIEIYDDHFAQNAEDPEWLTACGKKNWIVVTRDERIRYRVARGRRSDARKCERSSWQRRAIYEQKCWQRFLLRRSRKFVEL